MGGFELIEMVDEVYTPEKCQQLCNKEDSCNWFNWKDDTFPSGCWLLSNKGTTEDFDNGRTQGATGPKNCTGKYMQ